MTSLKYYIKQQVFDSFNINNVDIKNTTKLIELNESKIRTFLNSAYNFQNNINEPIGIHIELINGKNNLYVTGDPDDKQFNELAFKERTINIINQFIISQIPQNLYHYYPIDTIKFINKNINNKLSNIIQYTINDIIEEYTKKIINNINQLFITKQGKERKFTLSTKLDNESYVIRYSSRIFLNESLIKSLYILEYVLSYLNIENNFKDTNYLKNNHWIADPQILYENGMYFKAYNVKFFKNGNINIRFNNEDIVNQINNIKKVD